MRASLVNLTAAFLWPDLGWLTLRLVAGPGLKGWRILATATNGPWVGTWEVGAGDVRAPLAAWMGTLNEQDARALLEEAIAVGAVEPMEKQTKSPCF